MANALCMFSLRFEITKTSIYATDEIKKKPHKLQSYKCQRMKSSPAADLLDYSENAIV